MWGFWEKLHWRGTRRFGTPGYTALWDANWKPTPSAEMYRKLVFDEWWTRFEGVADAEGLVEIPAFLGTHRVHAGGDNVVVTVQQAGERVVVEPGKTPAP